MTEREGEELVTNINNLLSELQPVSEESEQEPSGAETRLFRSVLTDVERTSRKLGGSLQSFIAALDRQITEAERVRDIAIRRIEDLNLSREAASASARVIARKA